MHRDSEVCCSAGFIQRMQAKLCGRAETIRRLQVESEANRREAESCGRFELRFVEELDAIKAAVKFEETADSDGPVTLVQWCGRMAAEIACLNDVANRTCRENERRTLEISSVKNDLSVAIGEKATLNAEIERLRMLVLSVRDALNEYHRTKTENALDELTRLAAMCNRGELLDVPYVRSVIEAETAQLRRQLKDAAEVRDQRWQMAKDAKSAIDQLTECPLVSADFDDNTITLEVPPHVGPITVGAGLKIKADLSPLLEADPAADQPSKM